MGMKIQEWNLLIIPNMDCSVHWECKKTQSWEDKIYSCVIYGRPEGTMQFLWIPVLYSW